jgi:hypothetical protein
MEIEGSVRANLVAAVASARRLRDRSVHQDTIRYWKELIAHARRAECGEDGDCVGDLVAELETQLAERSGLTP